MSLPDRAMIANMAPEYGATIGFFPVDDETLRYLHASGRPDSLIELVESYCDAQELFRTPGTPDPDYTYTLELDLGTVSASLAGPKRPQDRIQLSDMKRSFQDTLIAPTRERGFELSHEQVTSSVKICDNGDQIEMGHGSVVIAAP